MADAIQTGRPHRCDGAMALHVIEVLTKILSAGETGAKVTMETTCARPAAFGKDDAKALLA